MNKPGQVHKVMRNEHGHVLVKHPKFPAPQMMAPSQDHSEIRGALGATASGGAFGGLDPTQKSKGAQMADFNP